MNILWRIAKEKLVLRTFLQVFKDRLTKITCNAINITRWIYNSNERSGDSVIFFLFLLLFTWTIQFWPTRCHCNALKRTKNKKICIAIDPMSSFWTMKTELEIKCITDATFCFKCTPTKNVNSKLHSEFLNNHTND